MNDKILTFEEYTMNDDFSSKHRIDEMATISRPTDNIPRKSKVIVYGENDEGKMLINGEVIIGETL